MTKRTLYSRTLALAVVLLGTTAARADLVPWGYNWSASPSFVTAGGGKVTLSNETSHSAGGDSTVVPTALQVVSGAAASTPDTFALSGGNYSLSLQLTDTATSQTGTLTFMGQLQGTFSQT